MKTHYDDDNHMGHKYDGLFDDALPPDRLDLGPSSGVLENVAQTLELRRAAEAEAKAEKAKTLRTTNLLKHATYADQETAAQIHARNSGIPQEVMALSKRYESSNRSNDELRAENERMAAVLIKRGKTTPELRSPDSMPTLQVQPDSPSTVATGQLQLDELLPTGKRLVSPGTASVFANACDTVAAEEPPHVDHEQLQHLRACLVPHTCRHTCYNEGELLVNTTYTSPLKPQLLLVDTRTDQQTTKPVAIAYQASLIYEHSRAVVHPSSADLATELKGKPRVPITVAMEDTTPTGHEVTANGAAIFSLKIRTNCASHPGKERFRFRFTPQDARLARRYPALTVESDPIRALTKLVR